MISDLNKLKFIEKPSWRCSRSKRRPATTGATHWLQPVTFPRHLRNFRVSRISSFRRSVCRFDGGYGEEKDRRPAHFAPSSRHGIAVDASLFRNHPGDPIFVEHAADLSEELRFINQIPGRYEYVNPPFGVFELFGVFFFSTKSIFAWRPCVDFDGGCAIHSVEAVFFLPRGLIFGKKAR